MLVCVDFSSNLDHADQSDNFLSRCHSYIGKSKLRGDYVFASSSILQVFRRGDLCYVRIRQQ